MGNRALQGANFFNQAQSGGRSQTDARSLYNFQTTEYSLGKIFRHLFHRE